MMLMHSMFAFSRTRCGVPKLWVTLGLCVLFFGATQVVSAANHATGHSTRWRVVRGTRALVPMLALSLLAPAMHAGKLTTVLMHGVGTPEPAARTAPTKRVMIDFQNSSVSMQQSRVGLTAQTAWDAGVPDVSRTVSLTPAQMKQAKKAARRFERAVAKQQRKGGADACAVGDGAKGAPFYVVVNRAGGSYSKRTSGPVTSADVVNCMPGADAELTALVASFLSSASR